MAHRTKHRQAAFYCYRYLHGFSREDLLMKHIEFCKKHASQSIIMPDESNNLLQFTSIQMQHPIAFTIFADFESLIVPLSTTSPSSSTSYMQNIARHEPCGYAYVVIGPDGKSTKPTQVYRGQNAVKHFLNAIIEEKDIIEKKLKDVKPLRLTPDEEASFQSAIICSICKKSLDEKRARDHDHISGKFRGSAHISCNLKYNQSKKIPVIFHNMKNYDGHHIMTELGQYDSYKINVIASTLEKYTTFSIKKRDSAVELVFLDSFQFLPTSLEKLVNNLNTDSLKF